MKNNSKAPQDKKAPLGATTEKIKNNSSRKEESDTDVLEEEEEETLDNKTSKKTGKLDSEKVKSTSNR